MRRIIGSILVAASLLAASPVLAAESGKQVDAICNETMGLVQAGKFADAYDASLGKSPLVGSTERASLIGQIEAAMKIFGPATAYELVAEHKIGTMAVRRFYFLQQENFVTRWEIDLVKTSGGWAVSYFGYDAKVQEWSAAD